MNDVAQAYDKLAEGWDKAYTDNRARAENALVFDLVARRLWFIDRLFKNPAFPRVLDLACGTGLLLDCCSYPIDPHLYVGLDISSGMIDQARLKHPFFRFEVADIEAEFPHGADLAVCAFAGVSYLREPCKWLRSLFKDLPPTGRVFLMPLAPRAEKAEAYHYTNEAGERLPRRVWSEQEARAWMAAAGFVDVTVRGLTGWSEKLTERVPLWLGKILQKVDYWTSKPDDCLFLIVEGRKP
jgi:SAM-dependent methyltransferase